MKTLSVRLLLAGMVAVSLLASGCSDADDDETAPVPTASAPSSGPTTVPGANARATLHGFLTVDGAPLDADFLGVRVIRDGLAAACQGSIPVVAAGTYDVEVVTDDEVRGCGTEGADLLLWTYVGDQFLYAMETVPWPGDGKAANFNATFSTSAPLGAGKPVTQIKGLLFDGEGNSLPDGSVVEAYVGDELCGVTSLPYGGVTEGYYTLAVAGPDAVPDCTQGATINFRVNDRPAEETAVNDLSTSARGQEINLTVP
jgi:hypothetical protein